MIYLSCIRISRQSAICQYNCDSRIIKREDIGSDVFYELRKYYSYSKQVTDKESQDTKFGTIRQLCSLSAYQGMQNVSGTLREKSESVSLDFRIEKWKIFIRNMNSSR